MSKKYHSGIEADGWYVGADNVGGEIQPARIDAILAALEAS